MSNLVLYCKNNCPACDRAKFILASKSLKFTVKNIDTDLDAMDFVVAKRHRAMPVVYDGDQHVQDISVL